MGRPHGLHGAFHVTRPRSRVLDAAATVTVAGVVRAVAHRGGTEQRPVLRLDGIDSREQADALRGEDLLVDRGTAPALEEDEWYAEDLAGCRVHDGALEVGTVTRLLPYPSCDLLEVRDAGGGSVLVPLIGDAVRLVDVEHKRIEIDAAFLGLQGGGDAA